MVSPMAIEEKQLLMWTKKLPAAPSVFVSLDLFNWHHWHGLSRQIADPRAALGRNVRLRIGPLAKFFEESFAFVDFKLPIVS